MKLSIQEQITNLDAEQKKELIARLKLLSIDLLVERFEKAIQVARASEARAIEAEAQVAVLKELLIEFHR